MTRTAVKAALLCACIASLVACGGTHAGHGQPAARLEHVRGRAAGRIVLSAVGARRIGLQTQRVQRMRASKTTRVPFSAVVYAPSGRTYVFVAVGRLAYSEVPVTVDRITGSVAYLRSGPHAGSRVVSTGAEELFGVQTGVLAQT